MKSIAIFTLLVTAIPCLAHAEMSGDVTLSYGQTKIDGLDDAIGTTFVGFSTQATLGSNVVAGVDLSFVRASTEIEGVDIDADLTGFGLDVAYRFDNGMSLGGYLQKNQLSASVEDFDLFGNVSATSIGLLGGYSMEGLDASAFVGQTTTDPDLEDTDIRDVGVAVRYKPSESVVIGGNFLSSTVESGGDELTLSAVGLAGGVSLSETWSLFAGLNQATLDGFEADMTSVGFGVGYQMPYFGATMFAEVSRSTLSDDIDSVDLDTLRVGMSFPIGGKPTTVPKGTVAGGVLTDSYSSAAQAVRMTF